MGYGLQVYRVGTLNTINAALRRTIKIFEWAVAEPVTPGEVVTVHLMMRGRWGLPRVVGVYRLGLDILVSDGQLAVTDTLVDERNRAVPDNKGIILLKRIRPLQGIKLQSFCLRSLILDS
ncbi:hypothetical protein RR48_14151 [Papilio machaon]|uniref:Uncharacterized protein n=1 Tax=Papilio machaon TaxID=76193 RepID=A0A194QLK3_PAPMA|nr:hypothetical protein RR48_14151 [Papilio machaon]